jgi:SHS family lactate transporter-like MFS transporter
VSVTSSPSRSTSRTIFGGLVPPVVTYFALNYNLGFSIPMLIGCLIGGGSWCLALYLGPETKGKEMVPDLVLA